MYFIIGGTGIIIGIYEDEAEAQKALDLLHTHSKVAYPHWWFNIGKTL